MGLNGGITFSFLATGFWSLNYYVKLELKFTGFLGPSCLLSDF